MKVCKSTSHKNSQAKQNFFASPHNYAQKENGKRVANMFFKQKEVPMDKTKVLIPPSHTSPPLCQNETADRMNLKSTFKDKFTSITPKSKPQVSVLKADGQLSPAQHCTRGSGKKSNHQSVSKNDRQCNIGPKSVYNFIKNPRISSAKNVTSSKSKIVFPSTPLEGRFIARTKAGSLPKARDLLLSDKFLWVDKKLSRPIKLKVSNRQESAGMQCNLELENAFQANKVIKDKLKTEPVHHLDSDEQLLLTASTIINIEYLPELNVDLLLTIFAKLLTLYCFIEQGTDTRAVIREYTEIIQHPSYRLLDKLICKSTETGQDLMFAFKMEIFSILIILYTAADENFNDNASLLKIVEKVSFNFYCFLHILKKGCEKNHLSLESKTIEDFLDSSNADKAFTKDIDYSKTFKKSNGALLTIILSLTKDRASPIFNERLKALIVSVKACSLIKSSDKLFEFFSKILKKEEMPKPSDYENTQRRPSLPKRAEQEPNFILQPFNFISLLPPKIKSTPYTLVLDLDETLVHYEEKGNGKGQFFVRPYSQNFIDDLAPYYEIVIFTAAMKNYADWIIDRLDHKRQISHRLYRCSTKNHNGVFIKDLSKIGRELSRTIIVDNNPDNFQYQPENGIFIKSWYDDPEDNALKELSQVLIYLSKQNYDDVRIALKEMREKLSKQSLKL